MRSEECGIGEGGPGGVEVKPFPTPPDVIGQSVFLLFASISIFPKRGGRPRESRLERVLLLWYYCIWYDYLPRVMRPAVCLGGLSF